MKVFFAIAFLVLAVSGLPQNKFRNIDFKNERIVGGAIADVIEDLSQSIRDAGLDPVDIDFQEGVFELPVPAIFTSEGVIDSFLFRGLSDIVINNINYNLLTSRLTFDLELPLIEADVRRSEVKASLFGNQLSASVNGRFALRRLRVSGVVRVNVGIISGISIRSIDLDFRIAQIESALNVVVLDYDLSNQVNVFLGQVIPNTLTDFADEIDELLEIILLDLINDML